MRTNKRSFASPPTRRPRHLATAAVAVSCLLLAGCGSSAKPTTSAASAAPAASLSSSPSPNATDAAKAKLLEAYQGFWNIQVQAYTSGSLNGVPVNKYALGDAFYDIEQTLQAYQQNHEVLRGRPTLTPQVTSLQVATKPYSGAISDCVDTSNFLPVDTQSGKPVQLQSNVHRHPWTFTATFDNVQWYLDFRCSRRVARVGGAAGVRLLGTWRGP